MSSDTDLRARKWILKRTNYTEETIEIPPGCEIIVGRRRGGSFELRSLFISRIHCKLKDWGSHLTIADMNSGNGTFVNRKRISAGTDVILKENDSVGLGVDVDAGEDCYVFRVLCVVGDSANAVSAGSSTGVKCEHPPSLSLNVKEEFIIKEECGSSDEAISSSDPLNVLSKDKHSLIVPSRNGPIIPVIKAEANNVSSSLSQSENVQINLDDNGQPETREGSKSKCEQVKETVVSPINTLKETIEKVGPKPSYDPKRKLEADVADSEAKKTKLPEFPSCSAGSSRVPLHCDQTIVNEPPVFGEPYVFRGSADTLLDRGSLVVGNEQIPENVQNYSVDDAIVISDDDNDDNYCESVQDCDNVLKKAELWECEERGESDDDEESWFSKLAQFLLEEPAKDDECARQVLEASSVIRASSCKMVTECFQPLIDADLMSENISAVEKEKCIKEKSLAAHEKDCISSTTALSVSPSVEPSDRLPLIPLPAEKERVIHYKETLPPCPSSSSAIAGSGSKKLDSIIQRPFSTKKYDHKTLVCDALPLMSSNIDAFSDKGKVSVKSKYAQIITEVERDKRRNRETSLSSMPCSEARMVEENRSMMQINGTRRHAQKKNEVDLINCLSETPDRLGEELKPDRGKNEDLLTAGTSKDSDYNKVSLALHRFPKNKKKTVQFATDDSLAELQYFQVESGNSLHRVQAKDAPFLRRNSSGGIAEFALEVICNWNIAWLTEQKHLHSPPPCYGSKNVLYPMLTSFTSFEEYKLVLFPLMFLNLWTCVSEDVEYAGGSARLCRLHFQDLVFHYSEPCGEKTMRLYCHFLLSEKASKDEDHPFVGDLCQLNIRLRGAVVSSNITGNKAKDSTYSVCLFAYVESCTRVPWVGGKHDEAGEVQPVWKINFVLRTKKLTFHKLVQLRVKVLSNIMCDLRSFEAVEKLSKSKLCARILNPTIGNLRLPHVDRRSELALQDDLNHSQKYAVLCGSAVCSGVDPGMCLILGPPGTGKTQVIVNIIMQVVSGYRGENKKSSKDLRPRILLCAPSDAAVDELVERLLKIRQSLPRERRFKMVRLGQMAAIRDTVRSISLSELAKKTLQVPQRNRNDVESTELDIVNLQARKNSYQLSVESAKLRGLSTDIFERKLADTNKKLKDLSSISKKPGAISRELQLDTERKVLAGAEIIATTLGYSYTAQMAEVFKSGNEKNKLTCCVVDEASQCLEPETLIPLMFSIDRLVLVGDPEQLPGTVVSKVAHQQSLEQSLLTRLCKEFHMKEEKPIIFLNMQYRMHEEICRWPNAFLYHNQLSTAPSFSVCPLKPYVVLAEEFRQNGKTNDKETYLLCLIATLVKESLPAFSVGIITPYQKQKHAIKSHLEKSSCNQNIIVNTIDSFQGQECDIVVLSCTRTTRIGSVCESNKLNVALTRARHSLIICGNFVSLKTDSIWKNLLEDAAVRSVCYHIKDEDLSREKLYQMIKKN